MEIKDLIQSYYDSLNNKDSKWQDMWAEDAVFSDASQVLVANGKQEIITSFTTFEKGVESLKVKQVITDGQMVCVVVSYNYINQKGEKMTQDDAEVWEVKNGKLFKLTIYFDLTAYRTFMRG